MSAEQASADREGGLRVLLVSHETSRSGAPRVAVLVARSLQRAGHDVRLVTRAAGPLLADFRAVAPTSVEPFHRLRRRLKRLALARRIAHVGDLLVAAGVILASRADIVYVNSSAAAVYTGPARWLRRPSILHVHESGRVASDFLAAAGADLRHDRLHLVACSPSVRDDLASLAGVDVRAVALAPSVPDPAEVQRKSVELSDYPYAPDELIIGACGTVERRKGADVWVQAARIVLRDRPDRALRFVWVGEVADSVPTHAEEPIEFIGARDNPYPHLRRFDIATLPSRDDPFPLAVLEAMVLGSPVVAFAVGGVAQQIGDAGIVVPARDVEGFACAIIRLVDDAASRLRLGTAAKQRMDAVHSLDAFAETVNRVVATRGGCPHSPDIRPDRCDDEHSAQG